MTLLERWKQWAVADAESRGIPGLGPLFEGLEKSLQRLRSVDWDAEREKLLSPSGDGGAS